VECVVNIAEKSSPKSSVQEFFSDIPVLIRKWQAARKPGQVFQF